MTKEALNENDLLRTKDEARKALKKLANEFSSAGYPRYFRMVNNFIGLLDEAYGLVTRHTSP
ncbi:MAG: hypothetical protein ABFR63_07080 [Thermodesulfobacteriota bacterium]